MMSCRELDELNKLHVLTTMIEHILSDLLEENAVLQEFLKMQQAVDALHDQELEMMVFLENLLLESHILEDIRDTESTFLGNLLSPPIDLEMCSEAIYLDKIATTTNMPTTHAHQMNALVHPFEEQSSLFPFPPVEHSRGKSKMLKQSFYRPKVVSNQVLREEANTVASENFDEPRGQAHLINSSRYTQMLEGWIQENPQQVERINIQEVDLSTMEIFLHRAQVIDFNPLDFSQEWMMPRHIQSSSWVERNSELDDSHQLKAYQLEEGFEYNTSIQGFSVLEELLSQKLEPHVTEDKVLEKFFALESPSGTNHLRTDPKQLDAIRQDLDTRLLQEAEIPAALNMLQDKPLHFEPSAVQEIRDLVDSRALEELSNKKINSIPSRHRETSEVYQADLRAHHMEPDMLHKCLNPLHRHIVQELPANLFDEFFQHFHLIPCQQLQTKILQESSLPVKSSMLDESLLEDLFEQSQPSKTQQMEPNLLDETSESVGRKLPRQVDGILNSYIPWGCIHDQLPHSNLLQQPQMPSEGVGRNLPVAEAERENYRPPNILRVLLPQPIKIKEAHEKNERVASSTLPQVKEQQLLFRDGMQPTSNQPRSNQPTERIERTEPLYTSADPHKFTHEESKKLQFITIDSSMDSEIMRKNLLEEDERSALNVGTKASEVHDRTVQNPTETAEIIACFKEPCEDDIKSFSEEIQPDASEPALEKTEQEFPSLRNSEDSGVITQVIGSSETCEEPRQPTPHELHPDSPNGDGRKLEAALPSRIQPFRQEHNDSAQLETASGVDPTPNPAISEQIDGVMHQQSASKRAPQVLRPCELNSLRSNHLKMLLEIHRLMNRNQVCGCADLVLSGEEMDILQDLKRISQSPQFCKMSNPSGTNKCNSKAPKMCQFREPASTLKISVFGLLVLAGGLYIVETLEKILCDERNSISAADVWDLMGSPLLRMLISILEG